MHSPAPPSRQRFLAVAAILALLPPVAAAPRDEVLRLVPDDVTFCLLVQDFREHTKIVQDAVADEVFPPPFGRGAQAVPELQALARFHDQVLKELEITPKQLREDIVGDAVAFAYRKRSADGATPDQGMVLLWARDPKLVTRIIDRVNNLQKQTGELRGVEEADFDGKRYSRRLKGGRGDEYYATRGNVFCFSTSEAMVREAVTRWEAAPPVDRELPPLTRRLQRLDVDKAFFAWWLNPRSFDKELTDRQMIAGPAEQAFLAQFLPYWRAAEGAAFFMRFDARQVETGVSVHVRKEELPAAARAFLSDAARPSVLWRAIPEEALLAIAGRLEGVSLAEAIGALLTEGSRKTVREAFESAVAPFLGKGKPSDLPAGLGPDWGFWAWATRGEERSWFPRIMLAVKVRQSDEGVRARDAVVEGLKGLTFLARLANSRLTFGTEKDGKTEIHYLAGAKAFPPGVRPAFATKGDYLLLAGSPQTIRDFTPPTDPPAAADETPLLRVSIRGWKNYLRDNKSALAAYVSETQAITTDEAARLIEAVVDGLEDLDRFEVVLRPKTDQASLILRLKASEPKK